MMNLPSFDVKYRILVTGSRGKSSLVRLITAGLAAAGLNVRGRVTGVSPRELSADGERRIIRTSPGHIEEMRWWLRQLPRDTQAVVMENSAVHPELQRFAALWMKPSLIVWTNARADHQEVWGRGREAAEQALMRGVPSDVPLVVGEEIMHSAALRGILERRQAPFVIAPGGGNFREQNLHLARRALALLGISGEASETAMEKLPPDVGDFRIFYPCGETAIATAFSANEVASTESLFSLLGWREEETTVIFSDRADRPERRASFAPFLNRPWREARILRGRESHDELYQWLLGKQSFGCGNIAGAPLRLIEQMLEGGCRWTTPGA